MRQNKTFFDSNLKPTGNEGTIQIQFYKVFLGHSKRNRGELLQGIINFWESCFVKEIGKHCLFFIVVRQAMKNTRCSLDEWNTEQNCDWGKQWCQEPLSGEKFPHSLCLCALLPYGFREGLSEQSLHATSAIMNAKGIRSLQTLLHCSMV